MTGATTRKLVTLLLSMVVLTGVMPQSASAKQRVVRGGFNATATPFPVPWESVPGHHGCLSGTEGQHKVSHPFTARFAGWLNVGFYAQGRWDLYLLSGEGELLAESASKSNPFAGLFSGIVEKQQIRHFVERGEKVTMAACNWAGATEAEVRYAHREGNGWSGAPTGEITHEESVRYNGPAVGTKDNGVACSSDGDIGCIRLAVWGSDRSVSIQVEDDVWSDVSFQVNQWRNRTKLFGRNYCGTTNGSIEIEPRVDELTVIVHLGACEDDSQAMAPTRGSIRAVFKG